MPQQATEQTQKPVKNKDHVRPTDTVTVYSTGKGGFTKVGEPMVVLKNLAEKLIEDGKATAEKPTETKTKGGQK